MSKLFFLDHRLLEILRRPRLRAFSIIDLREYYLGNIVASEKTRSTVYKYLYNQVLRLLREGWLVADEEKRPRFQLYHVLSKPAQLDVRPKSTPRGLLPAGPLATTPHLTDADCEHLGQLIHILQQEIGAHESERKPSEIYIKHSKAQSPTLPRGLYASLNNPNLRSQLRALEKTYLLLNRSKINIVDK